MSGRDWPPPEKMVRIEWALILNVFHSILSCVRASRDFHELHRSTLQRMLEELGGED